MKKASPALRLLLASWLADATSATPSERVRQRGLCAYVMAREDGYTLASELDRLFIEEFDTTATPFNDGLFGHNGYFPEGDAGKSHKNAARLAWVRKQLNVEPV